MNNYKTKKMKNKGFTLIELLVSVAIISGLGVLLAQAFFTTSRSNTKLRAAHRCEAKW